MSDWIEHHESLDLLRCLFPHGTGGEDVMRALCPEGWLSSPLRVAFYPTPEQRWKEHCRFHENLNQLSRKLESGDPPPDRETFFRELDSEAPRTPEPDSEELARLVGLCLWDILSNNHDLVFPDGQIRYMGSFRMIGGILSDFINNKADHPDEIPDLMDFSTWDMDYMDYYLGTIWVANRTDLSPIYRLIFKRLRNLGYSWRYSFPRLGAFRFRNPDPQTESMESYNPSEAFAREQEEINKDEAFQQLQDKLEKSYREAVEEAKNHPPPKLVTAFRDIYGHWPQGWPPE